MAILIDAGPVLATIDRADPAGEPVRTLLRASREPLVLSAQVTAEIDYLAGKRLGDGARRAFIEDLADGRYNVQCLAQADYGAVVELEALYADLRPGLTDLSLVVLAERFRTRRIVTFDQRHFRAMTPLQGGTFEILPADYPVG